MRALPSLLPRPLGYSLRVAVELMLVYGRGFEGRADDLVVPNGDAARAFAWHLPFALGCGAWQVGSRGAGGWNPSFIPIPRA